MPCFVGWSYVLNSSWLLSLDTKRISNGFPAMQETHDKLREEKKRQPEATEGGQHQQTQTQRPLHTIVDTEKLYSLAQISCMKSQGCVHQVQHQLTTRTGQTFFLKVKDVDNMHYQYLGWLSSSNTCLGQHATASDEKQRDGTPTDRTHTKQNARQEQTYRFPVLTFLLELVVHALQDWCELLAGGTPAGAKVHSQHLALERLRGYLGSIRLRHDAKHTPDKNEQQKIIFCVALVSPMINRKTNHHTAVLGSDDTKQVRKHTKRINCQKNMDALRSINQYKSVSPG